MFRRCCRGVLIALGVGLMVAAAFPVFAWLSLSDQLQMGLLMAKLLLLPFGAACFIAAAAIPVKPGRR